MKEQVLQSEDSWGDVAIKGLEKYGFSRIRKVYKNSDEYKCRYIPKTGGKVVLELYVDHSPKGPRIFIEGIHSEIKNEGHGAEAVAKLIEWAEEQGFQYVGALSVLTKDARRFWNRIGFVEDKNLEFEDTYAYQPKSPE